MNTRAPGSAKASGTAAEPAWPGFSGNWKSWSKSSISSKFCGGWKEGEGPLTGRAGGIGGSAWFGSGVGTTIGLPQVGQFTVVPALRRAMPRSWLQ